MSGPLFHFDDEAGSAGRLAAATNLASACIARHRFPMVSWLTLPAYPPERVKAPPVTDQPNEKLVELPLSAQTARQTGARHPTLVAPTPRLHAAGHRLSSRRSSRQQVVMVFAELFDSVITVDPASAPRRHTR